LRCSQLALTSLPIPLQKLRSVSIERAKNERRQTFKC
jgi:hypothetical protein